MATRLGSHLRRANNSFKLLSASGTRYSSGFSGSDVSPEPIPSLPCRLGMTMFFIGLAVEIPDWIDLRGFRAKREAKKAEKNRSYQKSILVDLETLQRNIDDIKPKLSERAEKGNITREAPSAKPAD